MNRKGAFWTDVIPLGLMNDIDLTLSISPTVFETQDR